MRGSKTDVEALMHWHAPWHRSWLNISNHMSLARLSSGKYVAIDALDPSPELKAEIDRLTDNGALLEAVIATHPFHSLGFPGFHR